MSGPKGAQVRPKIQRVIDNAHRSIDIAKKNNAKLSEISALASQDLESKADSLIDSISDEVPDNIQKYCAEDAQYLRNRKVNILNSIRRGKEGARMADQLMKEAEAAQVKALQIMNDAVEIASDVSNKINSLFAIESLYERDANRARDMVSDAERLEREATDKIHQALNHAQKAKSAFDSAILDGDRYTRDLTTIQKSVEEKSAAEKILEENKRKAVSSQSEIQALLKNIESLNHEKFTPGEFQSFAAEIASFQKSMNENDYSSAAANGENLTARLRKFHQKASALQSKYESERIAAQNRFDAAKKEIQQLDQNEIMQWTENKDEIDNAFRQIDLAKDLIHQEKFTEAETIISTNLDSIRAAAKKAHENKMASEERSNLAEVIMNALYEQGYDAPAYYYAKQTSDGKDIEFSDLTIFAKSPGQKGDMRMQIDLAGKVKLEVEGIAEGEEAVCHQLILDLQKGVGSEIDFKMTDWGRAAKVNPDSRIQVKEQEKIQEKTRERQNG
ncbi:MAG: hypothetical protein Q4G69_06750 [Planctomycetia bacterium]|nr:hypothetical protein [Planctomycetia bacterium]